MKLQLVFLFITFLTAKIATAQQDEYAIEFETVEVVSFNPDIVEDMKVALFKYNDTSQAVNATGTLKKDLSTDIKVNLLATKKKDNGEFQTMTDMKEVDFCDILGRNVFGLKDLLKYGNFTECPWKAGTYVTSNVMIDCSKLPPKAPMGFYKLNVHFFTGETPLVHVRFAGTLKPKPK